MAKCFISGRGPQSGNNRSHALNATKRKWNLNLQKVQLEDENGHVRTVKVSVRALRTASKTK